MNGEPDGRPFGRRPCHPVADMCRKEEIVALLERSGNILVLQQDLRGAGDHHDPFIPRLIEPFAGRGCLTGRDDPLDPDVCCRQQKIDAFRIEAIRDVSEQTATVTRGNSSCSPTGVIGILLLQIRNQRDAIGGPCARRRAMQNIGACDTVNR
jgi:hypothetical protein